MGQSKSPGLGVITGSVPAPSSDSGRAIESARRKSSEWRAESHQIVLGPFPPLDELIRVVSYHWLATELFKRTREQLQEQLRTHETLSKGLSPQRQLPPAPPTREAPQHGSAEDPALAQLKEQLRIAREQGPREPQRSVEERREISETFERLAYRLTEQERAELLRRMRREAHSDEQNE
jgi:hypothetical protein